MVRDGKLRSENYAPMIGLLYKYKLKQIGIQTSVCYRHIWNGIYWSVVCGWYITVLFGRPPKLLVSLHAEKVCVMCTYLFIYTFKRFRMNHIHTHWKWIHLAKNRRLNLNHANLKCLFLPLIAKHHLLPFQLLKFPPLTLSTFAVKSRFHSILLLPDTKHTHKKGTSLKMDSFATTVVGFWWWW